MTRATLFVLLSGTMAACGQKPAAAPAKPEPEASTEKASEASEPKATEEAAEQPKTSSKPLSVCDQKIADFDKTLSEASYECKKDADCGCFEGGLSRTPGSECGGVVDKGAAKKLAEIAKASKKDACSNGAMCEAWTCDPICEESRCQKGPRKKK